MLRRRAAADPAPPAGVGDLRNRTPKGGLFGRLRLGLQRWGACFVVAAVVLGGPLALVMEEHAGKLVVVSAFALAAASGALARAPNRLALRQVVVMVLLWNFAFGVAGFVGRADDGAALAEMLREPRTGFWSFLWNDLRRATAAFLPAVAILGVAATGLLAVLNRLESGAGERAARLLAVFRALEGHADTEPTIWSAGAVLPGLTRQ